MARNRSRTARRLATVPTILGSALVGALFLAQASSASAAERLVQPTTHATPQLLAPPPTIPEITVPTIGPLDPVLPEHPENPPCTGIRSNCPPPPKPPCDANHDGKLTPADWLTLLQHPDACRPPKPPCDANGDGKLNADDWRTLDQNPYACQPPDTSFRPPTRIDTGAGGSARTGLNFGQLALVGVVLTGLAGGILTIPRRRWSTGGAR
jgi:EF hand